MGKWSKKSRDAQSKRMKRYWKKRNAGETVIPLSKRDLKPLSSTSITGQLEDLRDEVNDKIDNIIDQIG